MHGSSTPQHHSGARASSPHLPKQGSPPKVPRMHQQASLLGHDDDDISDDDQYGEVMWSTRVANSGDIASPPRPTPVRVNVSTNSKATNAGAVSTPSAGTLRRSTSSIIAAALGPSSAPGAPLFSHDSNAGLFTSTRSNAYYAGNAFAARSPTPELRSSQPTNDTAPVALNSNSLSILARLIPSPSPPPRTMSPGVAVSSPSGNASPFAHIFAAAASKSVAVQPSTSAFSPVTTSNGMSVSLAPVSNSNASTKFQASISHRVTPSPHSIASKPPLPSPRPFNSSPRPISAAAPGAGRISPIAGSQPSLSQSVLSQTKVTDAATISAELGVDETELMDFLDSIDASQAAPPVLQQLAAIPVPSIYESKSSLKKSHAVASPTPAEWKPQSYPRELKYIRFLVLEVSIRSTEEHQARTVTAHHGAASGVGDALRVHSKVLRVLSESVVGDSSEVVAEAFIHLFDDWVQSQVRTGDYVHLVFPSGWQRDFGPPEWHAASSAHTPSAWWIHRDPHSLQYYFRLCVNSPLLLIVHPDRLVTGTRAGEAATGCLRAAALSEKIKNSRGSKDALIGTVAHEVFEHSLRSNQFDLMTMQKSLDEIAARKVDDAFACGISEGEVISLVTPLLPAAQRWATDYAALKAALTSTTATGGQFDWQPASSHRAVVSRVLTTEENIWSPAYGLKGKLDATVMLTITPSDSNLKQTTLVPTNQSTARMQPEQHLVPFELKTGKSIQNAHHAQLSLYTMMLSDRYDMATPHGLLMHLSAKPNALAHGMSAIHPQLLELRSLVLRRNELAAALLPPKGAAAGDLGADSGPTRLSSVLPPLLRDAHACGRCFVRHSCMLYHASVEHGTVSSFGAQPAVWAEAVGHLNQAHLAYFAHWDRLIDMEHADAQRTRAELWTLPSQAREKSGGQCVAGLRLHRGWSESSAYFYEFRRAGDKTPFGELGLAEKDSVVVSVDSNHPLATASSEPQCSDWPPVDLRRHFQRGGPFAVAHASITSITTDSIVMRSRAPLHLPAVDISDELVNIGNTDGVVELQCIREKSMLWRVDRDDVGSTYGLVKANLMSLFVGARGCGDMGPFAPSVATHDESDLWGVPADNSNANQSNNNNSKGIGDVKRRRLIVDLLAPRFRRLSKGLPGALPEHLHQAFHALNADQQRAVERVLCARDYALVLGMPGTGKTTTIVFCIRALIATGKSVLLTAYTHSAVDTILLKLLDFDDCRTAFMRLSSSIGAVHEAVRHRVLTRRDANQKSAAVNSDCMYSTVAELQKLVGKATVLATTCLGVQHPVLLNRMSSGGFDVCIVDEASQVTQPVCLGPLRYANSFVLVGDHYQLPPLVASPECRADGMGVSLFRRLCEASPSAIVALESQYRMAAPIMSIANTLVYNHQLRCGTREIAQQCLRFPALVDSASDMLANVLSLTGQPYALPSTAGPDLSDTVFDLQRSLWRASDLEFDSADLVASVERSEVPSVVANWTGSGWLAQALCPSANVMCLDTDALVTSPIVNAKHRKPVAFRPAESLECRTEQSSHSAMGSLVNPTEVALVTLLVHGMLALGVPANRIGVITPYRAQHKLLRNALSGSAAGVEVLTIDKVQGRDMEVVLMSLVRSNYRSRGQSADGMEQNSESFQVVGSLLREWRRINVAVTRARAKLLVIGSVSTLRHAPPLRALLHLLSESDSLFALPCGAQFMYAHLIADSSIGQKRVSDQDDTDVQCKKAKSSP